MNAGIGSGKPPARAVPKKTFFTAEDCTPVTIEGDYGEGNGSSQNRQTNFSRDLGDMSFLPRILQESAMMHRRSGA